MLSVKNRLHGMEGCSILIICDSQRCLMDGCFIEYEGIFLCGKIITASVKFKIKSIFTIVVTNHLLLVLIQQNQLQLQNQKMKLKQARNRAKLKELDWHNFAANPCHFIAL